MKYLKLFENHISESEVAKICKEYGIINWTLNNDGTVDVNDSVLLIGYGYLLTKLPLKFGRVEFSFSCSKNFLTSLEWCPSDVSGNFYCYENKLTSLEGCPQYVGGSFYCELNNIRTFEGIGHISGDFYCYNNPIFCIWSLFRDTSKIETFNEWEVIQNNQVILYRLNDFLAEIGKEDVTEDQLNEIKKYYTVL